jgi:hypothetical protein
MSIHPTTPSRPTHYSLCLLILLGLIFQSSPAISGVSPTALTHATITSADPLLRTPLTPNSKLADFARDRIQVGMRISHKTLLSPTSDSFIGSVDTLEEVQHYLPPQLFLSILVNRYLGIELSHDQIEAETITSTDGHTDGVLNLRGPTLQIFGNLPFVLNVGSVPTRMAARAGLGVAYLRGTFEDEPWWHHGFPGPPEDSKQLYADWVADGAPEWPNDGLKRHMSVEDDVTWFMAASLQARFYDRLSAELRLQYMELQSDATVSLTFGDAPHQKRYGSFDLDTISLGLGVLYTF